VLVSIARRLDARAVIGDAHDREFLAELDPFDRDPIANAMIALANAHYIDCCVNVMLSGDKHVSAPTLTERERRAVGIWPNQEKAAEHVDDAGALKKAGRLLGGVPASVPADVTAALIRLQSGIG
jgi:hypothetical protein